MSILICKKCGQSRGRHQVFSYNCPTDTGFSSAQKFELQVMSLSMDGEVVLTLKDKPLDQVEKEVARRVLKHVEHALACYDLAARDLTKEEVVDALTLVKRGYDL